MNFIDLPGTGVFVTILIVVLIIAAALFESKVNMVRKELLAAVRANFDYLSNRLGNYATNGRSEGYTDRCVAEEAIARSSQITALQDTVSRLRATAVMQTAHINALASYLDVELTEPMPGPTYVYVKRKPAKAPRKTTRRHS